MSQEITTITKLNELQEVFDQYLLLADRDILKVMCATVISNQFKGYPNWLFLVAASSGGKSLDGNTDVLCYDGSLKKAKEIKKGDILMGDDSTPRVVLGTHSGEETMYKVEQQTGDDYIVNEPHILTLKQTTTRNGYKGFKKGDTLDIELTDYLNQSSNFKKTFRGFKVGVDFKSKPITVDPYFLGIWLGDGHMSGPVVSKPDTEIKEFIKGYASKLNMNFSDRPSSGEGKCRRYAIIKNGGRTNPLWQELMRIGVTQSKHIPHNYKTNTREIRLQVLAGLLDTDGYLDRKRGRFEFVSKDKILADDVVFLARSLGFSASCKKTIKGIKSSGFSGKYWRVQISGPTHEIPTKIKRKRTTKRFYKRDILSTGIKIKKLGKGRYYGFQLDGNGRFILGDFTVTHNSELIQSFFDIKLHGQSLAFPISDLTVNAFASGQKKVGKETSLLHQIPPGGLLFFKDFTSMISKAKEARSEIFKQLREIYDGSYIKRTGTGENIDWKGKIGAIAGATQVIYEYQQEFATMGDRFIMYAMKQPDRKELLDFILDDTRINADKIAMQEHLKQSVSEYIGFIIENMKEDDVHLAKNLKEDLKNVADFCTKVRSGVVTDERRPQIINFAPDHEMPVRMINQLLNLAKAFIVMEKAESGNDKNMGGEDTITDAEALVVYKVAFDSIPIKRRIALKALAKYEGGVSTKGLATSINYQTAVVGAWMAQLNALGICTRQAKAGPTGDLWNLKQEYRDIMVKFEHIEVTDKSLDDEDDEADMVDEAFSLRSQAERDEDMGSLDFDFR